MHLHILGISGTFMSALAILARELGFKVTGSDANCYPPISDLLVANGIKWTNGYEDATQALMSDCVIVGNTMKRGLPIIEAILNARKPYISGPQWLAENVLPKYKVMAVAGTHGKTTTTSMLALILEKAGLKPGFLIGGVASDFNTSTRLGKGEWFVIEADEYDTAFFDKRPKFMHYHPQVAILNNLEFDHADIYPDLLAIKRQFQYLLRTVPGDGLVIKPKDDLALNDVVSSGIYTTLEEISLKNDATWRAKLLEEDGRRFQVLKSNHVVAEVNWNLIGDFNVENGLAALAASAYAGVSAEIAADALSSFTPVKRRLEVKSSKHGITVYDDFAHHPTAIHKTITALKQSGRHKRIFVVLEFASNTMKSGVHALAMEHALDLVDRAFILKPEQFDIDSISKHWKFPHHILTSAPEIVDEIMPLVVAGDGILVMSNRSFGNIHEQLSLRIAAGF